MDTQLVKVLHNMRGALHIVMAFVRSIDETRLTEEQRELRTYSQSNLEKLRNGLDAIDAITSQGEKLATACRRTNVTTVTPTTG